MSKTMIVGLTGQTGAGKSTVSSFLKRKEAAIIDADEVARYVTVEIKDCLMDLALEFGITILNGDGSLNRRGLGKIVFGNRDRLDRLNSIIFPYITGEILRRIQEYKMQEIPLVFLDAPTLFESGTDKYCDLVVSVISPKEERLKRIMERDNLSVEDAEARISSQYDDKYYTGRSWHVIVNDATKNVLLEKTYEMLKALARYYDEEFLEEDK